MDNTKQERNLRESFHTKRQEIKQRIGERKRLLKLRYKRRKRDTRNRWARRINRWAGNIPRLSTAVSLAGFAIVSFAWIAMVILTLDKFFQYYFAEGRIPYLSATLILLMVEGIIGLVFGGMLSGE